MSANRSALGLAALWATFCVVLLACGWLTAGGAGTAGPAAAAAHTAGLLSADSARQASAPSTPAPELPAEPTLAAETGADPEPSAPAVLAQLRRTPWVAVVPLWPSDALRWQRLEPSLRLNPGHAPPHT